MNNWYKKITSLNNNFENKFEKVIQKADYTCGPAALKALLSFYGIDISEEKLEKLCGTTEEKGTYHWQISEALDKLNIGYLMKNNAKLKDIYKYIINGYPVLVDLEKDGNGHYSIVIGMDNEKVRILDTDSKSESEIYKKIDKNKFKDLWYDKNKNNQPYVSRWMCIIENKNKKADTYLWIRTSQNNVKLFDGVSNLIIEQLDNVICNKFEGIDYWLKDLKVIDKDDKDDIKVILEVDICEFKKYNKDYEYLDDKVVLQHLNTERNALNQISIPNTGRKFDFHFFNIERKWELDTPVWSMFDENFVDKKIEFQLSNDELNSLLERIYDKQIGDNEVYIIDLTEVSPGELGETLNFINQSNNDSKLINSINIALNKYKELYISSNKSSLNRKVISQIIPIHHEETGYKFKKKEQNIPQTYSEYNSSILNMFLNDENKEENVKNVSANTVDLFQKVFSNLSDKDNKNKTVFKINSSINSNDITKLKALGLMTSQDEDTVELTYAGKMLLNNLIFEEKSTFITEDSKYNPVLRSKKLKKLKIGSLEKIDNRFFIEDKSESDGNMVIIREIQNDGNVLWKKCKMEEAQELFDKGLLKEITTF